jgi:hypothetical protein
MARPCSICIHDACETIDQALADGLSYRSIADVHGVSKSALLRHQQHQEPQAVTDTVTVTGHVTGQAQAPCTCPCTRIEWAELAHDAKQLHAYMQQVQTQDEALHYMKFYLMRFAALIASAIG